MNNSELYIPVVLGTAREGRLSEAVAKYVHKIVTDYGVKTDLIDVKDHVMTETIHSSTESSKAQPWRDIAAKADGFVLVAPEYNHGYPGELKMLLDRAYEEYWRKPIGICGVGGKGGIRMVESLKTVLLELQAVPTRNAVYFAKIRELFDEAGDITDDSYHDMVVGLMDEVTWYIRALKEARANENNT